MTWPIYRHPSDPAGPVTEENQTQNGEAREGADTGATPPDDPTAKLKAELAAAKGESEQWRDRFLRKAAEFENFRKRTDKEKLDSSLLAKSSVLSEFLPVLDACERALESLDTAKTGDDLKQYREGVKLLYKQVGDTLRRLGVEPIKAEGQPFDPNKHEALSREASSKYDENMVTRDLRRGYLYQGRLLRPSQVVVSIGPQKDGEQAPSA